MRDMEEAMNPIMAVILLLMLVALCLCSFSTVTVSDKFLVIYNILKILLI